MTGLCWIPRCSATPFIKLISLNKHKRVNVVPVSVHWEEQRFRDEWELGGNKDLLCCGSTDIINKM